MLAKDVAVLESARRLHPREHCFEPFPIEQSALDQQAVQQVVTQKFSILIQQLALVASDGALARAANDLGRQIGREALSHERAITSSGNPYIARDAQTQLDERLRE